MLTNSLDDLSALTSFEAGPLRLRNRLAFIATVNNLGRNREITDELVAFYEARARGGVGLIVTEGMSVHPTSIPNGTVPLAYDPGLVPGLTRLTARVHDHGAQIVGQLWHVGRQALWNPSLRPWSPSGGRDPYSGTNAHEMSSSEVREVVEGFATSAANLQRAGFDGVELHGAHGYLITQFLSPWSNHRRDEWGGDASGRARFVVEVIRAIQERCGPAFAVGLKLTAHEYVEGGLDLDETQRLVTVILDQVKPAYLGVSQANFSPSLEYHVPDLTFDDTPFVHLAAGVREVAGEVAVMAMAKVPDVASASELIENHTADLVGMSRAWLVEPDLVRELEAGRQPRPCTYCNVCWEHIHTGRPVSCMYSPQTGREALSIAGRPAKAVTPRVVRVVGGGVAGLEASRTAATAGHEVHLYTSTAELGGRLREDARTPGRERMAVAIDWLEAEIRRLGVAITEAVVDDAVVESWGQTDVVLDCTGAKPVESLLPGAHEVLVLSEAIERLQRSRAGGEALDLVEPVVVIDEMEDEPVYAAATAFAEAGLRVLLVSTREALARRVAFVSRIGVLRRLDDHDVTIHPLQSAVEVRDGELVTQHIYSGVQRSLGRVGTIVTAGPFEPSEPLKTGGRLTYVVGDASAPRGYVAITQEAHDVAAGLSDPDSREDLS